MLSNTANANNESMRHDWGRESLLQDDWETIEETAGFQASILLSTLSLKE